MRKQSADDNTKIIQMLELSDKDFKAVIIKMLQRAITNSPEIKISASRKIYKRTNLKLLN